MKKPRTVLLDTAGQPWPMFPERIPRAGLPFLSGPTKSILHATNPLVNFFDRAVTADSDTKEQAWLVLKS
jgi:hypothetical protein